MYKKLLAVEIDYGDRHQCPGMLLHDVAIEARDGDRVFGRTLSTLELGSPEPVFFEWQAAGFVGSKRLTFTVDPDSKFGTKQHDNVAHTRFEVQPATRDLRPVAVRIQPAPPVAGGAVTFHVEVEDRGPCPSAAIADPVRIRLSEAASDKALGYSEPFQMTAATQLVMPVVWRTLAGETGLKTVRLIIEELASERHDGTHNHELIVPVHFRE